MNPVHPEHFRVGALQAPFSFPWPGASALDSSIRNHLFKPGNASFSVMKGNIITMSINQRQNPVTQKEIVLRTDPIGGGGSGLRSVGVGGRGFVDCSVVFWCWGS